MRKCQDEQQDGLCDRTHNSARGDKNCDSMFGARVQIDVVVAYAAAADATKPRDSLQGLRRDLRLQRDKHVVVRQLIGRIFSAIFSKKLMRDSRNAVEKRQTYIRKYRFSPLVAEIRGEG